MYWFRGLEGGLFYSYIILVIDSYCIYHSADLFQCKRNKINLKMHGVFYHDFEVEGLLIVYLNFQELLLTPTIFKIKQNKTSANLAYLL